eukprot:3470989-Rhodomonas_salina.4
MKVKAGTTGEPTAYELPMRCLVLILLIVPCATLSAYELPTRCDIWRSLFTYELPTNCVVLCFLRY